MNKLGLLPGQHTENQVHDEEGAEDDHGDKVDELPCVSLAVVHPVQHVGPALEGDALEDGQHGLPDVVKVGDAVLRAFPVLSEIVLFLMSFYWLENVEETNGRPERVRYKNSILNILQNTA